jgi:hypothetical protein
VWNFGLLFRGAWTGGSFARRKRAPAYWMPIRCLRAGSGIFKKISVPHQTEGGSAESYQFVG